VNTGGYGLVLDGWLPTTHATYLNKYGKQDRRSRRWSSGANLTIAVNKSVTALTPAMLAEVKSAISRARKSR